MALSFSGRLSVMRAMGPVSRTSTYTGVLALVIACVLSVDDLGVDQSLVLDRVEPEQVEKDLAVVLAQVRRPTKVGRPGSVNEPREAQRGALPAGQAVDVAGESPGGQMSVGQHVGGRERWRGRDAPGLQHGGRRLGRQRPRPRRHGPIDLVVTRAPTGGIAQAGVGSEIRPADAFAQGEPGGVTLNTYGQPAIIAAGRIHPLRREQRIAVPA